MEELGVRLNKYLSESGICSRRKADILIDQGRVLINGKIAHMGDRVSDQDIVTVEGQTVQRIQEKRILAFYKPRGLVCSANGQGAQTVEAYMQYPIPLYYVGRLDKDSEGLLLLTNDGELANRISKARYGHEKEYLVRVNRPVTGQFLKRMSEGVRILDTVTRPCKVRQTGEKEFSIILTQGLNRQIRRMCEACGYYVRRLKRVRVVNITLENLEPGQYRELTATEVEHLKRLLRMEK